MTLGSMNHIALTVTDRPKSEPFYDRFLSFMGYEQVEKTEFFTLWWQAGCGAIEICDASPDSHQTHDRYAPGFHHLAFSADSREQVDDFYKLLLEMGATILDPPAEYNYTPGYYAVFFADPDGLKLELVHAPGTE